MGLVMNFAAWFDCQNNNTKIKKKKIKKQVKSIK